MNRQQMLGCLILFALAGAACARGQEKIPEVTEGTFRQAAVLFLEYPDGDKAADYAKVILKFAADTPRAEVLLDDQLMKWVGKDRKLGLLLLAGYLIGDVEAQIDSGVRRDDPYSGLLKLVHVHHFLKKRHADYQNPAAEELLQLHRAGRLITHLQEVQKQRLKDLEKFKAKQKEKKEKKT